MSGKPVVGTHADLSEKDISDAKEAFMIYDKVHHDRVFSMAFIDHSSQDGGGTLSVSELGPLLRALGLTPSFIEVREIVQEFDNDGNGELDFQV